VSGDGGAVFIDPSAALALEVHRCIFMHNTAANGSGGAIAYGTGGGMLLKDAAAAISTVDARFEGNRAFASGGAVVLSLTRQSSVTIQWSMANCSFVDNAITDIGLGGAVSASSDPDKLALSWRSSEFRDCNAYDGGGALRLTGVNLVDWDNLTFVNNSASLGGAVFWTAPGLAIDFSVRSSRFVNNTADKAGGAVCVQSSFVTDLVFTFSDSICASNTAGLHGGCIAMQAQGSDLECSNVVFQDNLVTGSDSLSAVKSGHHMPPRPSSNHQLARVPRASNRYAYVAAAREPGPSGTAAGSSGYVVDVTGGAVDVFNSRATFDTCIFRSNHVLTGSGGAISASVANVEFRKCSFDHCQALVGGAIALGYYTDLILSDSHFTANQAISDGGALYANVHQTITSSSNTFELNSAGRDGGAVYLSSPTGADQILNLLTARSNVAQRNGGALALYAVTALVPRSQLENNTAVSGGGGAMYLEFMYREPECRRNCSALNGSFVDNAAAYGPDIASPVRSLNVLNSSLYDGTARMQLSGKDYPIAPMVIVEALDMFGQRVKMDLGKAALISVTVTNSSSASPSGAQVGGVTTAIIQPTGLANFSGLYLVTTAGPIHITFSASLLTNVSAATLSMHVAVCPPGTASELTNAECITCAPGRYSALANASTCLPCQPGRFNPLANMTACRKCGDGRYPIEAGSDSCLFCPPGRYTLRQDAKALDCQDCVSGMVCTDGSPRVKPGFWWRHVPGSTNASVPHSKLHSIMATTSSSAADVASITTLPCFDGACLGGDGAASPQCSDHRLPSSPLCGQCESGYIAYPGSSDCVQCTKAQPGWIVITIALMWVVVIAAWRLARSADTEGHSAELKIFFFFASTARVILGPSASWTSWITHLEGSGLADSGSNSIFGGAAACLLPLQPYQISVVRMMTPFMLLTLLAITAGISWLVSTASNQHASRAASAGGRWISGLRGSWHPEHFVRAATMLVMFR